MKTFVVGGVPEHFNLPWHLAIEQGLFEKAGLKVQYKDFPGGTGALSRALQSGELDLAVVLTEGIAASILNGNPARIIKTYVQTPLIWGVHVAADSDIQSESDMQGRSYAISRFGSGSHLMAIVDADQRGWEGSQLEFVKVGNLEGARKALAAGEAELFMWEKFMTKPLVDGGEFRRVAEVRTPWPCFMIAASEEVLAQYPEEIKAILAQINQSCELLMKEPEKEKMIASRYGLKEKDVEAWLSQTSWNTDVNLPTHALNRVVKVLRSLELIPGDSRGAGKLIWLK